MCGIAGFIGTLNNCHKGRMRHAIQAMHHRGPDDSGIWTSNARGLDVAMGQTRLSIIDLSYGGHQPMQTSNERYVLTFNGEIYNYKELRSELEVNR